MYRIVVADKVMGANRLDHAAFLEWCDRIVRPDNHLDMLAQKIRGGAPSEFLSFISPSGGRRFSEIGRISTESVAVFKQVILQGRVVFVKRSEPFPGQD